MVSAQCLDASIESTMIAARMSVSRKAQTHQAPHHSGATGIVVGSGVPDGRGRGGDRPPRARRPPCRPRRPAVGVPALPPSPDLTPRPLAHDGTFRSWFDP